MAKRFRGVFSEMTGVLMKERVRQAFLEARYLTFFKSCIVVIIFLFVCSSAFPNGYESNVALSGYVPVTTPADELPSKFGLSDNHFYVQTGLDIADRGSLSSDSQFSLRQWAPGTSFLIAGIVCLFGTDVPLGIIWGLFLAVLWTVIFGILVFCRKSYSGVIFLGICSAFLLHATPFHDWFFSAGYFYSESISIAFGALAFVSIYFKGRASTVGILIGACLALAAYFKGTYEFVGLILSFLLAVLILVKYINSTFLLGKFDLVISSEQNLKRVGFAVFIFHLFTVPWRIWSNIYLYPNSFTLDWTAHTSQYWGHRWMPSDWLEKVGSSWFSTNGGNSACILDLEKCKQIADLELPSGGNYSGSGFFSQSDFMRMSLETFFQHPLSWLSSRIPFLKNAWFPPESEPRTLLWGAIFLISTLLTCLLLLPKFRLSQSSHVKSLELLIYISTTLGTFLPLLLQQIEPRYLYPVQILSFLNIINVVGSKIDEINVNLLLKAENKET